MFLVVTIAGVFAGGGKETSPAGEVKEEYPSRPIKILIPYSPGGGTDSTCRVISSVIYPEFLDQPFVLINRPGANGAVAIRELLNSEPDGYTLMATTTSSVVLVPLTRDVPFELENLVPIARTMDYTGTLCVKSDAPWQTLQELVEYSKANPGEIRYSTAGAWSMEDLTVKALNNITGAEWTHIPFPGGAEAATACISGAVEVYAGYGAGNPQIMSGLLRPVVVYGNERVSWLPDVPTLQESGYDVSSGSCMGFFGPEGLPPEIVDKVEAALHGMYNTDAYQKIVTGKLGLGVSWMGAEEFDSFNKALKNQFIGTLKELGEYKD